VGKRAKDFLATNYSSMPNAKVECLLCREKISENRVGSHLMSSSHRDELLSSDNRKVLSYRLDRLEVGKYFDGKNELPTLKVKGTKLHLCVVCKKCYFAEGVNCKNHYKNNPACAEGTKDALKQLLLPTLEVKKVGGDGKELLKAKEEIEALKRQLKETKTDEALEEDYNELSKETKGLRELVYKLSGFNERFFANEKFKERFNDIVIEEIDTRGEFNTFRDQYYSAYFSDLPADSMFFSSPLKLNES